MLTGDLIGVFKCDVWYVYNQPDGSFFSKFCPLLDGYTTEIKGYLRVDLQVISYSLVFVFQLCVPLVFPSFFAICFFLIAGKVRISVSPGRQRAPSFFVNKRRAKKNYEQYF